MCSFYGTATGAIEADLGKYGAEKFYKTKTCIKRFNPSLYAAALSEIIKKNNPYVLGGNTLKNQDYLPRVASRTGAGLAIDAIDMTLVLNQLSS